MHRILYIFILLILAGFTFQLHAQCKEQSVWENAWISCEMTPNPNSVRGTSHWLQYDLGYDYQLTSVQIWNHNKVESLEMGAREVVIDYSNDGKSWTEAGRYSISQGEGNAWYSGEVVGNLNEIQARFLLLTFTDNWGHPSCTSIDEVSFRLKQAPIPQTEELWLFPNPATDHATVSFKSQLGEELEVRVLNLLGQTVSTYSHSAVEGKQFIRIELADVKPGLYVVQIVGEESILGSKKLVVVNR